MRNADSTHSSGDGNKKWRSKIIQPWTKVLFAVVIAGGVFVLGWGFGNGKLAIQFGGLHSVQKSLPAQLSYSDINKEYDILRQDFAGKLSEQQLIDGMMHGLAEGTGDPHTEYFNPKEAKVFQQQLDGTFSGIGAELSKKDDNIVVVSPLKGYPAKQAGIQSNDIIAGVDGKSTTGMGLQQVVNEIRGPKGTKVKLTIVRNGTAQTISITRTDITIPSVTSSILDGNIGYMQISQFSNDTTDLAAKAAKNFKDHKVKGVILDLRGNPGGLLHAAVGVSSLWLDNKTILTERRGGDIINTYTSVGTPVLKGIPTVVLIDSGSASASEITSGALHDNNAATLMGTTSYGKGSVQEVENLDSGAILKVTIAHWYTPDGRNIDKQGIKPDKTVELTQKDVAAHKDTQKQAAIEYINSH